MEQKKISDAGFDYTVSSLTFRKNNPPAGSTILWLPDSTLSFSPSLNQSMVDGPSALQFNVAGSCLGTITSMGCSVIRGYSKPERKQKEN